MNDTLQEIRSDLENALTGAILLEDDEAILRISRALNAFNAPVDIEIFSKKFYTQLFSIQCPKVL